MLSTQEETAASEVPEDKEDFTNMSFDNGKSMQKKRILDKSYTAKLLSFAAAVCICFTGCARDADRYELRDEAVALYQQGDYQGALSKLDEALKASDGQASGLQYDILKYKAECELRIGDYSEAKTAYEALVKLDEVKENTDEYNKLLTQLDALDAIKSANELFEAGEYRSAYEELENYAVLDGTLAGRTAWYNMAVCQEYLGKFDEAAELLNQYTEKFPDDEAAKKEYEFCRSRT